MSQTLESMLACVQIFHCFLSYDLKAEGNKHWNSQKQTKHFFFHRIQCIQSSMTKTRAL